MKNNPKYLRCLLLTFLAFLSVLIALPIQGVEEKGALERIKKRGAIIFCADPFNFPFSTDNPGNPGFDVEIANLIAQKLGVHTQFFWVNTGTRGGLGRAIRNSILEGKCDAFPGLPTGKEAEEEMEETGLVLSEPYFGTGFVLITREEDNATTDLSSLKGKKIAVEMTTPADWYLYKNGYDRSLYRFIPEILDAMQKGEVDAGLVWAPMAGSILKERPESKVKLVENYALEPTLRWNLAIAVRKEDQDLKETLSQILAELLEKGQIKEVLDKYGVPFYPPFPEE